MKRDLDLYLERREPAWRHELGWQSRQVCQISLGRDGALQAGPLHMNAGPAITGQARTLRYAVRAGKMAETCLESLSVLVVSDSGELLALLELPAPFMHEAPSELDVRALRLPLQSKLRLLFKTRKGKDVTTSANACQVESWLALAA